MLREIDLHSSMFLLFQRRTNSIRSCAICVSTPLSKAIAAIVALSLSVNHHLTATIRHHERGVHPMLFCPRLDFPARAEEGEFHQERSVVIARAKNRSEDVQRFR